MKRIELAHRFILEEFARVGRSPSVSDIQRRFGLATAEDTLIVLEELQNRRLIHRRPGDTHVTHAYPFSNVATQHRVRIADGPEVFAMCAIDALGIPFMLDRDAAISSACGQCKSLISVEIANKSVVSGTPAGIVVWVGQVAEGCVPASDLCPDLNFFCAAEDLHTWRVASGGLVGTMLTLDEAVHSARRSFEHLLGTSELQFPASGGGP